LYRNRQQRTQVSDEDEKLARHHFAVVSKKNDPVYDNLLNESLARLGVWPLWVAEDYEYLPNRLDKLRKALSAGI
jgi:hypothetical protein